MPVGIIQVYLPVSGVQNAAEVQMEIVSDRTLLSCFEYCHMITAVQRKGTLITATYMPPPSTSKCYYRLLEMEDCFYFCNDVFRSSRNVLVNA